MAISIDTLKRLSRDQRNFFLIFGLLGLGILMGISLVYLEISDILRGQAERRSYLLAQTASDKDIILRKWVAGLGGIYAPVTPATPPNPWLPEAGRDFTLPGGMRVTRMNPAYVTRLVHALWREHSDIPSRIVSAKPVNPANRALPWEAAALGDIERRGGKEYFILSGDPQKARYSAIWPHSGWSKAAWPATRRRATKRATSSGASVRKWPPAACPPAMRPSNERCWRVFHGGRGRAVAFSLGGHALLQNIARRDRAEKELRAFAATLESKVEQRTSDLREAEKALWRPKNRPRKPPEPRATFWRA